MPTEDESREYLAQGLQSIWDENKRFLIYNNIQSI